MAGAAGEQFEPTASQRLAGLGRMEQEAGAEPNEALLIVMGVIAFILVVAMIAYIAL